MISDESRPPKGPVDGGADLPLVTIITPTYNRVDLLEETIESVLAQEYPRIEYIVLDDGSTDDTRQLLARLATQHPGRFHWESHPNAGQAATVNRGFAMARGEFITLVNSDDPLLPHALEPMVEVLRANPSVALVYPDWVVINEQSEIIEKVSVDDVEYVDLVRFWVCLPGPGTLFRRTLVARIGGWDPSLRFTPDFDFYLRGGLIAPFLHVPVTVATWRSHAASTTAGQRGEAMAAEHTRLIDGLFARGDLPGQVLAARSVAYRNAYALAAILADDRPAGPGARFRVLERPGKARVVAVPSREPSNPTPGAVAAWLRGQMAVGQMRIDDLRAEIAATEEMLGQVGEVGARRACEIARHEPEAAMRAAATECGQRNIAEKDRSILHLKNQVEAQDAVIAQLRSELGRLDSTIEKLRLPVTEPIKED